MSNWKNIEGMDARYLVSEEGQISSNGKILKLSTHTKGYKRISLRLNGLKKNLFVHRLVAIAFIPKVNGNDYVNHKNGIKEDNHVCNLEWVTASENNLHVFKELGINGRKGKLNKIKAKQ